MLSVQVVTAIKPTAEILTKIKKKLEAKHGPVEIESVVDPTVVGGVNLVIGSRSFDNTIKNKLKKIKTLLIKE